MKYNTWCPLFPGFYGTLFEPDESNEIYSYNQENNTDLDYDDFEWHYGEYRERVSKAFVNRVERELNDFLPVKIKYESLHSPREYNFTNDSINVEIKCSLHKLIGLIKERRENATLYFENRFTSRSGFISFHSPDIDQWLQIAYIKENLSFRVGALLECLLWCEIDTDDIMYWADGEGYLEYTVKDEQEA